MLAAVIGLIVVLCCCLLILGGGGFYYYRKKQEEQEEADNKAKEAKKKADEAAQKAKDKEEKAKLEKQEAEEAKKKAEEATKKVEEVEEKSDEPEPAEENGQETPAPVNGGSTNGGSTNGGSTNGGSTNGDSTNGDSTNGGSTNGGGDDNSAPRAPDNEDEPTNGDDKPPKWPHPNELYVQHNLQICKEYANAQEGPYMFNEFNRVPEQAYGITFCRGGEPKYKSFYMVNGVECPTGTTKLGWIKDTAITPRPNNETYGLTVCRGPLDYTPPQNITLHVNNVECPSYAGKKIGWIKESAINRTNASKPGEQPYTDSYGVTICRK